MQQFSVSQSFSLTRQLSDRLDLKLQGAKKGVNNDYRLWQARCCSSVLPGTGEPELTESEQKPSLTNPAQIFHSSFLSAAP